MRVTKLVLFASLVLAVAMSSIAAMPSVLAQPSQPNAAPTANGGELLVTWNPTAGAQFYTVGWVNRDEYQRIQNAGRNWLDAFHFATIPSQYTSHTVSGLQPNGAYYVIIGAGTSRFGGDAPVWSPWSNVVNTAGQHGSGFCPVTGLPLPPGGYLAVGDTATHSEGILFTLTSVTRQSNVRLDGVDYIAPQGRQYIKICGTVRAPSTFGLTFLFGLDYNIDTDAGIGFISSDDSTTSWLEIGEIRPGTARTACDIWVVSRDTNTVIVAFNDYSGDPALYRVDL